MKVYRTQRYGTEIREFEAERETENCYYVIGLYYGDKSTRRVNKQSEYDRWHPSFESARQYLLDREQGRIESAQRSIAEHESNISKIKALEPTR